MKLNFGSVLFGVVATLLGCSLLLGWGFNLPPAANGQPLFWFDRFPLSIVFFAVLVLGVTAVATE